VWSAQYGERFGLLVPGFVIGIIANQFFTDLIGPFTSSQTRPGKNILGGANRINGLADLKDVFLSD